MRIFSIWGWLKPQRWNPWVWRTRPRHGGPAMFVIEWPRKAFLRRSGLSSGRGDVSPCMGPLHCILRIKVKPCRFGASQGHDLTEAWRGPPQLLHQERRRWHEKTRRWPSHSPMPVLMVAGTLPAVVGARMRKMSSQIKLKGENPKIFPIFSLRKRTLSYWLYSFYFYHVSNIFFVDLPYH